MAKITVDLTEATEGSVLLAPGAYKVKVAAVDVKKSKAGAKMMSVKLAVPKQGSVFTNVMLEGPGAFKFIELATAVGAKGVTPGKKISFDPETFVGKVLGIITDQDEYEGNLKTDIKSFIPKDSVDQFEAAEVEEEEDEDDFDEEEEVEEVKPKTKSKTKTKKKPAPKEEDEDEDDDEFDLDF